MKPSVMNMTLMMVSHGDDGDGVSDGSHGDDDGSHGDDDGASLVNDDGDCDDDVDGSHGDDVDDNSSHGEDGDEDANHDNVNGIKDGGSWDVDNECREMFMVVLVV